MQSARKILFSLTLSFFSVQIYALPFSNLFVFGDSLSDNGNLLQATGGTLPDPTYYDQGRFSNGENYAESLWQKFGFTGDLTPRTYDAVPPQGTNYSVGGARSRYHALELDSNGLPPSLGSIPTAFSLLGQVGFYTQDLALAGISSDPGALYSVWSGANDIADIINVYATLFATSGNAMAAKAAADSFLHQSTSDFDTALRTIISTGAKNFLIPNLPNIGRTPRVLNLGPGASVLASVYGLTYNGLLETLLDTLESDFSDLNIIRFDTFSQFDEILNNPADYNLSNTTDACLSNFYVTGLIDTSQGVTVCGKPDEYVFWDIFHPSTATHQVIADKMYKQIPIPATFLLMIIGLLFIKRFNKTGI